MSAQKILVTGSAGAIGHTVCAGLRAAGHFVLGFDQKPDRACDDSIVGDLKDAGAVVKAARGVDCIVHLAAVPERENFAEVLVPNNIVGTHNVLEAARLGKVKRVVYASSCRVVGGLNWNEEQQIGLSAGLVPGDHYGVSKAAGEILCRMYSVRFAISVLCVRLGWFVRNQAELAKVPTVPFGRRIYLSRADAVEFFRRAVLVSEPRFDAVFLTSHNGGRALFDLAPAESTLGFVPKDTWPEGTEFEQTLEFASPLLAPSLMPDGPSGGRDS